MSGRFDETFIEEVRARTSLVALIGREVPLKRRGREHWGPCPFHKERTPSFSVAEGKGFWHCFGCGAHGDAFHWLQERHGFTFVEAVEELAIRAGLRPDKENRKPLKPVPVVERESPEEAENEKQEKVAWARALWRQCRPGGGTLAEVYLRAREITLPLPPTVRFHASLKHSDTGLTLPAMVAAVQDGCGRITGIHRTFLRADGGGKAEVGSPKKMVGACWGGAVRLAFASSTLAVAEGIETSLSVMQATGRPVWAALSLGNIGVVELPPVVREVVLCADADAKDPAAAEALLMKAAERHAARGRRVRVARPATGADFNDMLVSEVGSRIGGGVMTRPNQALQPLAGGAKE
jgi:DNA primase